MGKVTISKEDMLRLYIKIGRPFQITLRGVSMQPVLLDGDIIRVCPCDAFKKGDIALFHYKKEGELVHRIISIQGAIVFCKGDNAFRIEKIPQECLLGKVTERFTGNGWESCCINSGMIKCLICFLSKMVNLQIISENWNDFYVRKHFAYKFLQWMLKQKIFYL